MIQAAPSRYLPRAHIINTVTNCPVICFAPMDFVSRNQNYAEQCRNEKRLAQPAAGRCKPWGPSARVRKGAKQDGGDLEM
jgi:hypothetical protein